MSDAAGLGVEVRSDAPPERVGGGAVPSVRRPEPAPLHLGELPVLMLVGPAPDHLPPVAVDGLDDVDGIDGIARREVAHVVAGETRRVTRISGVQLPLSDAGLDRAAGLVALGADHTRGCLAAHGLSLGDATRYAARLERLNLRAENAWPGLAEGYYVLDAEPWNLRRLVDTQVLGTVEDLLDRWPAPDDAAAEPSPEALLVLLGPTCTTVGP